MKYLKTGVSGEVDPAGRCAALWTSLFVPVNFHAHTAFGLSNTTQHLALLPSRCSVDPAPACGGKLASFGSGYVMPMLLYFQGKLTEMQAAFLRTCALCIPVQARSSKTLTSRREVTHKLNGEGKVTIRGWCSSEM